MQIVFDIDETIFKRARYEYYGENEVNHSLVNEILISVINGTILPKGHGGLIDETELKKELIRRECSRIMYDTLDHILSYMKPIIEADKE